MAIARRVASPLYDFEKEVGEKVRNPDGETNDSRAFFAVASPSCGPVLSVEGKELGENRRDSDRPRISKSRVICAQMGREERGIMRREGGKRGKKWSAALTCFHCATELEGTKKRLREREKQPCDGKRRGFTVERDPRITNSRGGQHIFCTWHAPFWDKDCGRGIE